MGCFVTQSSRGRDQGLIDKTAFASLSAREDQVLSLAAAGFLDKQIGVELGVSLNTLRTYWTRIRSKVGEGSRSALAVAYVEQLSVGGEHGPDWEIDIQGWIWRKLSDRPHPIEGPVGFEISVDDVLARFHPGDQPGLIQLVRNPPTNPTNVFTFSARYFLPDGEVRSTAAYIRVVRDQAGSPLMLQGHHAPIHDVRSWDTIAEEPVTHDGWVCDLQTDMVMASDKMNQSNGLETGVPHHRSEYGKSYYPEDYAKGLAIINEIGQGKYETGSFTLRTLASGGTQELEVVVHGIRSVKGEVIKVIGYRGHLRKCMPPEPSQPRVRVGFWGKSLRTGAFIAPDEEFCSIYRVNLKSPALDRDIRSRYRGPDVDLAYDFIDDAIANGRTRGSHEFTLYFEDGSQQQITLEFFVEHDELGPFRVNGTVLAYL